jgi:hypothetical protein
VIIQPRVLKVIKLELKIPTSRVSQEHSQLTFTPFQIAQWMARPHSFTQKVQGTSRIYLRRHHQPVQSSELNRKTISIVSKEPKPATFPTPISIIFIITAFVSLLSRPETLLNVWKPLPIGYIIHEDACQNRTTC